MRDPYGRQSQRPSGYDVMLVCENGHQISSTFASHPERHAAFCKNCGAPTISECKKCQAPIQGHYHVPGVISLISDPVPSYCHSCGGAYPWQEAAIQNLQDIAAEVGLDAEDQQALTDVLPDIVRETPKSESAALKAKRVLGSLGKPAYELTMKVLSDLASETAKKTLFPH